MTKPATSELLAKAEQLAQEARTLANAIKSKEISTPKKIGGCDWIDWNELSRLGLLVRINAEILHPLGLAVFRDPLTGQSGGALIADDGVWEYSQQ
ncbi:DUF7415 domain-containing protein [Erwinia aphidicola]|uniref:DUF7415 domain-containing protein n=1 Tax=Erwinia aphidicola TaxID=68334 RepID=UPI003016E8BD